MEINDTLFQTLLGQQNITEFRPFRIAPRSIGSFRLDNCISINHNIVNLNNIYAYIKENIFYVCNEKFENIKLSDIDFPERGLHHIGYTNDEYVYPFADNDNSIVVDSEGRIVRRNPENFFYVGTTEFLEATPFFLDDCEDGLIYDFIKRKFVQAPSSDHWKGNKNYGVINPTLGDIKLKINGYQDENYDYLFSVNKNDEERPYIVSYFFNTKNKSIVYFASSKDRDYKNELTPVCLWYTNNEIFSICIKLLNEFDSEGKIIRDNSYEHVSFEIKVDYGNTYRRYTTAILELQEVMSDRYDLERFYNCLEFHPTKDSILILGCLYNRINSHVIIVNRDGKITFCEYIRQAEVTLTENNILRLDYYPCGLGIEYYDIHGTLLCKTKTYSQKYQVFKRNMREPITFNHEEILAHRRDIDPFWYQDGVIKQLEGVIDLENGNVLVPPCYSRIQLRIFESGNDETLGHRGCVSIVQIDNYFKGEVNSYFGIYLNENLITPVGYSNIQYLKYQYFIEKSVEELRFNKDYNLKEYDSIFILLEKNGLYGVASQFGFTIIEPCASAYKILMETQIIPREDEPSHFFLRNVPSSDPEYFTLCKNDSFNLIYRDKIVCDFVIDDFELISLHDLFFVKAIIASKEAIIYKGEFLTDFYNNVNVFDSNVCNSEDDYRDQFVIVVTDDKGNSSLLNSKSETIIKFGPHLIVPYLTYIKVDSIIYDIDNNIIFDASDYSLVDEKYGYRNEHMLCFHNENIENEYVIIDSNGEVHKLNIDNYGYKSFYIDYKYYHFDINLLAFVEDPEDYSEETDDYDYSDHTDYERDTFYALGGYDYDEWKDNYGNIDEMMDDMGY